MAKKIIMIPESDGGSSIPLEIEKNLIIVGANGSGKSRLGLKIEQLNSPHISTRRIAAQRSLAISGSVQLQDNETAERNLNNSYVNQLIFQPEDDFEKVMTALIAQEIKLDEDYSSQMAQATELIRPALSAKKKVVNLWNQIFPDRKIRIEKDLTKCINNDKQYLVYEMSDGEKVALYLISQLLLIKQNSIIIIDEPELHLHKALMVRLWNKLEKLRDDCTFIYISHDLDFAVNKPSSIKIWTQKYYQDVWTWEIIKPNEEIPENLYLELLGSKEPILFVEGEKGSLDIQLLQAFYEDFTVIPRGNCEKVIESVKGLRRNEGFHHKKVFGLIDRDARSEEEIKALLRNNVFTLDLSEIENLFLLPDIIQIVCDHVNLSEKKAEIVDEIKKNYLNERALIQFKTFKNRSYRIFFESFGKVESKEDLEVFKTQFLEKLDNELQNIKLPIDDNDIMAILECYPGKGLVGKVQTKIGLINDEYTSLVIGFLQSEKRSEIINILDKHLPKIQPIQ